MCLDGRAPVELPVQMKLSRKREHTVLISAPDRKTVEFKLKAKFDGLSLANLIYPGGSIGMLTDFLTGADKAFTPLDPIKLPPIDPAGADHPTLVMLHQHKAQLLTQQQLHALNAAGG